MPRQLPTNGASPVALEAAAAPSPARLAAGVVGEAGSRDALAQLSAAMGELKALAIQPMLQRAVDALQAGDHATGYTWALKALERDERSGFAWYLLGISREVA